MSAKKVLLYPNLAQVPLDKPPANEKLVDLELSSQVGLLISKCTFRPPPPPEMKNEKFADFQ